MELVKSLKGLDGDDFLADTVDWLESEQAVRVRSVMVKSTAIFMIFLVRRWALTIFFEIYQYVG